MSNVNFNTEEGMEIYKHSASHIMAHAVKMLWPDVKLAIGPAIKDGFYYDFDMAESVSQDDLPRIEEKMQQIVDMDILFVREELRKEEAIELFKKLNETYKLELLHDIEQDTVTVYRNGDFVDLCRGPHVKGTGVIKNFKLLDVAGAYWRGDEKNKMLQRIYGTAFPERKQLKKHLHKLEQAKLRDHRKLGKELELFSVHNNAGAGLIFWHPKGGYIRNKIETFWREEHLKRGYDIVYTPHIAKLDIWKQSGHWDFYREYMYSPMDIDNVEYIIKPMNCPGHILMFKSRIRSYKELPYRWAELGTVYRYERSGVLHGMLRVRGFTQDDAHIFCTQEQVEKEVEGVLKLADFMMQKFGFEYKLYLSTRPEKFVGTEDNWDVAINSLKAALENLGLKYEIDPGEGVFYGPKIDIKMVDALEREWQGPTIQVDFNLPQQFNVTYVDSDGQHKKVVMVHRTVLGSMERFTGILIEHYGGRFPLWLAPVQVSILPFSDEQFDYAKKVRDILCKEGFRVNVDFTSEKINGKIKNAELEKIPYMLVLGKREVADNTVSLRKQREGNQGGFKLPEVIQRLKSEINEK